MAKLIDRLAYPCVAPDRGWRDAVGSCACRGGALPLGQYAVAWQDAGAVYLARDPLGLNPLFFGYSATGGLVVANRVDHVLSAGVGIDEVHSCPPGRVLRVGTEGVTAVAGEDLSTLSSGNDFSVERFQAAVADKLDRMLDALACDFPGARLVVCLSGGLDSSVVAVRARKRLQSITAVSFSYLSEDDLGAWLKGASPAELSSVSDDFRHAHAVAQTSGIPLAPVFRPRGAALASAPLAVGLAQDWRDFNVHCAVVNLFLAQDIRARFPGEEVVVLTGDLMNEFVCDYHAEVIDGVSYYPQPRMSLGRRRRFFVRGLDAGDREIGVFHAYGLTTVQIYHAVARDYLGVPEAYLEQKDAKWALNGVLLPDEVRAQVGQQKQRAQVGGADGGTLGIFHRAGLDEQQLLGMWADALPGQPDPRSVEALIQFGRYRMPV